MTTIEKVPSLKEDLRDHNQQLMKEVDRLFKEQEHQLEHAHGNGMDFEM